MAHDMTILDDKITEACAAAGAEEGARSTLVSRNVTVLGRRTSVRLEPEMWAALRDIAAREKCRIHDICSLNSGSQKPKDISYRRYPRFSDALLSRRRDGGGTCARRPRQL